MTGTALYAKWFTEPIPPKGINLNIPMSAAIKKAFEKPTDCRIQPPIEQQHLYRRAFSCVQVLICCFQMQPHHALRDGSGMIVSN
jgi:hypothetical protein